MKITLFEDAVKEGHNPFDMCNECGKNSPVVVVALGPASHPTEFELCEECKRKLILSFV